jgi:hypothetical protein
LTSATGGVAQLVERLTGSQEVRGFKSHRLHQPSRFLRPASTLCREISRASFAGRPTQVDPPANGGSSDLAPRQLHRSGQVDLAQLLVQELCEIRIGGNRLLPALQLLDRAVDADPLDGAVGSRQRGTE